MKESELRIGNYVYMDNDVVQITGIVKGGFYFGEKGFAINLLEWWKPIPLTEDWLIRLCFRSDMPGYYYNNDSDMVISVEGYVYFGSSELYIREVNYVHELQNLFYAINSVDLIAEPTQIAQNI